MREILMIDNSVEQEVVPTVPDLNSFRVISERNIKKMPKFAKN